MTEDSEPSLDAEGSVAVLAGERLGLFCGCWDRPGLVTSGGLVSAGPTPYVLYITAVD